MANDNKQKMQVDQSQIDRKKLKRKKVEPQTGGSTVIKPTAKEVLGNAD